MTVLAYDIHGSGRGSTAKGVTYDKPYDKPYARFDLNHPKCFIVHRVNYTSAKYKHKRAAVVPRPRPAALFLKPRYPFLDILLHSPTVVAHPTFLSFTVPKETRFRGKLVETQHLVLVVLLDIERCSRGLKEFLYPVPRVIALEAAVVLIG